MKENKNSITVRQQYSGPIPPATELIRYNEACPDAADRIISMAENQARHRQECEKKAIGNEYKVALASIFAALIIALVFCGIIIYSLTIGQFGAAIASAIAAIGTVIGIFIGRKVNSKEDA